MKQTLKTIVMLTVSGVSAWACGETFDWNKPLSMFFAALFIGILAAMFLSGRQKMKSKPNNEKNERGNKRV